MAFITLAGTLRDPTSELAVGDQIRFTHKSTTGETVEGAVSVLTIDPSGTYSKDLQYGLVLVEYKDVRTSQFKNLGVATVNGSNPATSIPELLNALVPVSSAELIEFQAILADAVTARDEAEAFAASIDLINDLSQAYTFATVAAFKASLIEFPDGKIIHLLDRGADFTKITGTGTANTFSVIASASVNQSIVIEDKAVYTFISLGGIEGGDSSAALTFVLGLGFEINGEHKVYSVTSIGGDFVVENTKLRHIELAYTSTSTVGLKVGDGVTRHLPRDSTQFEGVIIDSTAVPTTFTGWLVKHAIKVKFDKTCDYRGVKTAGHIGYHIEGINFLDMEQVQVHAAGTGMILDGSTGLSQVNAANMETPYFADCMIGLITDDKVDSGSLVNPYFESCDEAWQCGASSLTVTAPVFDNILGNWINFTAATGGERLIMIAQQYTSKQLLEDHVNDVIRASRVRAITRDGVSTTLLQTPNNRTSDFMRVSGGAEGQQGAELQLYPDGFSGTGTSFSGDGVATIMVKDGVNSFRVINTAGNEKFRIDNFNRVFLNGSNAYIRQNPTSPVTAGSSVPSDGGLWIEPNGIWVAEAGASAWVLK